MVPYLTAIILTYNEERNIGRTLESLRWAERVVVLDSYSDDGTETIARSFPNVQWHVRAFDSHRAQWEYAVRETNIETKYVLALDADMAVPPNFVIELDDVFLKGNYAGGITRFDYRLLNVPLKGSVYPSQLRVFQPHGVKVAQSGHTQEFSIIGPVYRFKTPLVHEDRKSLERWVASQVSYSHLEEQRIRARNSYRFRDRLREIGVMPLIAGVLAYIRAGGPFRGAAAVRYANERAAYESLLAIRLLTAKLDGREKTSSEPLSLQAGDITNAKHK